MTEGIPPIELPKNTKYIRHLQIESKLLTAFWGRSMRLGAIVLVPEGFDEKFEQTHFPGGFGFREAPPTPEIKGGARRQADRAYRFFQEWSSGCLNFWSC